MREKRKTDPIDEQVEQKESYPMKKKRFTYILMYTLLCLLAAVTLIATAQTAGAQTAGFTLRQVHISNDSLHLSLEMDLRDVSVNTYTAVLFSPVLESATGRKEFSPVIVSGRRRYRFDRRQWVLASVDEKPFPAPYLILTPKNTPASRRVNYYISVPYAAWMAGAALLMKQEVKDCCDLQLLGTDTVSRDLSMPVLMAAPPDGGVVKDILPAGTRGTAPVVQPVKQVRVPHLPITLYSLAEEEVTAYADMLSFLEPDLNAAGKRRAENVVLYLDYPLGRDDVLPDYKGNRAQLEKLATIFSTLTDNRLSTIEQVDVCGYSSPDGDFRNNERLAADRSRQFAHYVRDTWSIPAHVLHSTSVAEDWDGFRHLLIAGKPYYMDEALNIIRRYGVFGGRERKLMELQGGRPYKDMLQHFFPRLRRIEVTVRYGIRAVEGSEASHLLYTHPELLSLPEIYAVARYYRPGTAQYREVYEIAAYRYPDDVVANVNAASAVMLTGDLESARGYLEKTVDDPRSWNNQGMLALMEGDTEKAIKWFRRAVGIEPRKARRNLQIAQGMLETEQTTGQNVKPVARSANR